MKWLFEIKDDLVLISTWQPTGQYWYCWGSIHYDAFDVGYKTPWKAELRKNGVVIVDVDITVNTSLQLPPDNLS